MGRRIFTLSLAFVLGLAVGPIGVFAQEAQPKAEPETSDLPSGAEILDRYVEATGGKEAYENLTSRKASGSFSIPAQGINGSMSIVQRAPNDMVATIDLGGMGQQVQAFTDGIAWSASAMQGDRVLSGVERADMLREATFNAAVMWRDFYKDLEVLGKETVDGQSVYAVKATPKEGTTMTQYFSEETGLLVQTKGIAKSPMGEIPIVSTMSDWREVDGVKMPFKTTISQMGMAIEIAMADIEHNVEIEPSAFKMPESIQKLVEKAKKKEEGKAGEPDEGSKTKPKSTSQPR